MPEISCASLDFTLGQIARWIQTLDNAFGNFFTSLLVQTFRSKIIFLVLENVC